MNQQHHYPYKYKRHVFDDKEVFYQHLWKKIFPSQYSEGYGANERSYSDSNKFVEAFIAAHIAEQPKETIASYLKLAHQFCQAHFRLLLNPNVDLVLELDGHKIAATGKKMLDYMAVSNWHKAFCLALVLRDNEALIGTLCRFQPENYINPKVEDLPIDYPYCKFLQGLFAPNADLQVLVQEIAKLSAPEYMPERRQSFIYNIRLPFIELIITVLARDENRYHQGIEKALIANKNHFSIDSRKSIAEGWLPMHICAAAAMAYDQCGFKLPFASPYLPEWLIYGDFEH
ncbi:immunity 49 family protein [Thalassotalea sp. PLHSN55]|uniref:immunity 49 family protein n=1 Tax=Thalassotalea sp. PLHSN55 TaxID=3435888 RepID=UPI003F87D105